MKKILDSILSIALTVAIILPGIPVQAAVPQIINFQGRLTNSSGVPITNASPGVNIVFKLYDQSNAGGNQLGSGWSETQTGVPVSNGIFSVQIGSNTALPLSVFGNTAVYVDISVGGETLYPRPRLLASPYALNSATAEKLLTARNINGVAFDGTADITISGYTHPNHSGDVTSVGDGATAIAANAVTLAKFQQIATQSILGRTTASTGNAEVLTAAQTKTILGLGSADSPTFTGLNVSGQVASTLATGTSPLSVNSTTKVSNLNADLLDGLDSTAFGDATAANQTTILSRIGTDADTAGTSTLFAHLARLYAQNDSAYETSVALYGWGSAPACPSGWTEIVAQTSAGTISPVTSITTTGISPLTGINTRTIETWTGLAIESGSLPNATWASGVTNGAVASGGSATAYTVANGGSATTYTYYYRICGLPK